MDDYTINDDDMFGYDFLYNKFQLNSCELTMGEIYKTIRTKQNKITIFFQLLQFLYSNHFFLYILLFKRNMLVHFALIAALQVLVR